MIVVVQQRQLLAVPYVSSHHSRAGQVGVQLRAKNPNAILRQTNASALGDAVSRQAECLLQNRNY